MGSDQELEITIDKILNRTQSELSDSLKKTFDEIHETLTKSQTKLEQEYDRIIDEGRKESEKLEKQIIGSADLESRNKQLLLIADSVEKVFKKAVEKIQKFERNKDYSKLITALIDESTKALGTSEVVVFTNSKDKKIVESVLSKFSGAELSSDTIDCLGGVQVQSKDGTMTFNNTIDARLERLKPLIRKEIATKFGIRS
ncbi:MAG: V-type ATP synthase subunit E [Nitrosopumilaceae archaeon]